MIPTQKTIEYFIIPEGQSCTQLDFNMVYLNSENIQVFINDVLLSNNYTITNNYITFDPAIVGISKGTTIKLNLLAPIQKLTDISSNLVDSSELNNFLDSSTLQISTMSTISENQITINNDTNLGILQNSQVWVGNNTPYPSSLFFDSYTTEEFNTVVEQSNTKKTYLINPTQLQNVYSNGIMVFTSAMSVALPITPLEGVFYYINQKTPILTIGANVYKTLGTYILMYTGGTWKTIGMDVTFNKYIAITKSTTNLTGTGSPLNIPINTKLDIFNLIPANTYSNINSLINVEYTLQFTSTVPTTITINANYNTGVQSNTISHSGVSTISCAFSSIATSVSLTITYPATTTLNFSCVKYTSNLSNFN